ncbi:protein split ends isoform X3 [Homalodisca vitripennis]|uniref:protein split ends isoform X3 n=1 Tax=Homalodisca vitripennis TaxID=197043 RepID=UPI001EEC79D0|nr:protein split ends isoform X3 [Homalodisca vitripennis]
MVRETRHLWVGNLPENIREDRIRDHFKRYGRVQSVKLLPRAKDDEGSGACATVSFMDIKSASKAHNNEQKLEDRTLTTEYHEPAAIPGSAAPIYSSQRFSHGPPEEISSFERSSHFYERERDRRDGDAYLRRASSTYHVTAAEPLRGRTRDRHYRNGPYTPIIESVVSRQPPHHRSVGSSWSYDTASRYPQPSTTPDVYADDRRDLTPVVVVHKKHTKSRSGSNGSESGSNSGSSVSRSRSSSSSSQSGSSSCSSASSSPASDKSCSTHSHHGSLRSGVTLQSAVSTPHTNNSSPAVHSDDRRPLAICVRNLPARSSDTSLKDGLFHEYKKHGKVTWVKVVGQGSDRYALVCFKKPDDVEKALQVSHDKLFFGCKIEVAPYQGYDVDDNEFRPYEAEQDEFHPKATRTLFIGNLEKDITAPELRKHFDQFGEIIEIDIKKQGSNSSYAFCQYCDIGSVVRAMRTLDGEHLGNNRIKLGFGKSLHTNCVWVDGVAESVTEKYLSLQFSQFGPVSHVAIDRSRGHALVFYDQIAFAQSAVKEMRGVAVRGRKLQVDFASRECQEAFYDHLEKQAGHNTTFENSVQVSPQGVTTSVTRGFETPSSSSSSSGGGSSRYPRYSTQPSVTRSYSRGTAVSPGASPSTPARSTPRHISTTPRFDFNSDYIPERRPYRSYEEMSMEDGGGIVTVTVGQGPQDIRHLQKERVALLEQLEDCASSGEEGNSRRRCKHRRSHSGEGSRPGTPLCDERPENLPPLEPRRTPRERPPDPLSLPLPRFATQLLSPRPAPPSPPASPPRPNSTSSDDSEPSPPSPEWEERLRSLDEKYEKWSGSRTVMTKVDTTTLRVRHKLLDLDHHELQPSDIVKSVLAKRSVFDEDSKRLENFGEKYEPREFVPTRPGFSVLRPRMDSPLVHSPVAPKSPAAGSSPAGAKGLQYPFPSHPPVQPTTSVATTTAPMSMALCSSLSSGITTVSSNTSLVDSSKSPQTFSTTSLSSVPSVKQQFQTPTTFNPPPKISPPSTLEKKVESPDSLSRLCSGEKSKSSQKSIVSSNTEKTEVGKKDSFILQTPVKPLKSCLRRESGDERRELEGRRRSRDEDAKVACVSKSDNEKGKEIEVIERRRSLSDPRRRDSVDSNKDSLRCESVSDKLKDRNHKEERRRRDSVDVNVKKDTEIIDTVKSRLSDSRVSEHSDTSDCSTFSETLNKNIDTQRDDNIRHTQVTDTSEKNKDSLQVCPERDRRRGRDSVEICSDNTRHRKVPESLDIKRELESDTRQKDSSTDKNDTSFKKSVEFNERRKDSGHSETPKNNEIFDRRKEKDGICQENSRHKERKDQVTRKEKEIDFVENSRHKSSSRKSPETIDSLRHKDDRLKSSFLDSSKHRENNLRRESESSEEYLQKHDSRKELDYHQSVKYKDQQSKKEQHFSDSTHNIIKTDEINENMRHKDGKRDNEFAVNIRHKENSKHHDFARNKDEKKKESAVDILHSQLNDVQREDYSDLAKLKSHECEKNLDNIKPSNFEFSTHRYKDYDRRKDSEKHDPRLKNIERNIHNDIFENCKHKNSDKHDAETANQISEWVEEIRKDLESSGFAKGRDAVSDVDQCDDKKTDGLLSYDNYQHIDDKVKQDIDMKIKNEINREDEFDTLRKESEKKKFVSIESAYFERKKNNESSEIFRRKEILRKKENSELDHLRIKDLEKKRDNDFMENSRHKNFGERKRESCDRERYKDRDSIEYITDNNKQKEWFEEKHSDKKNNYEKIRKSNKEHEYSEKDCCESDSNDNRKDDLDSKLNDSSEHFDEESARKNDFIKKDKKKERLNSWPAAIGCKRRLSSQDSLDICGDESKKSKPERRDSKDSGRSSSSSKKSNSDKHKSFAKLLEEKIKEDKEKEMNKKRKDDEINNESLKIIARKDKKSSGEKRKEDRKGKIRHKENGITASESEAGSGDDDSKTPKRHSIFDIVDEEPAYISMYDKVKARSTKNMQKQEEEKRQERLKEKFNQLKQSRAKREEKKRSTSYDEDSDSERGGRRSNKLMITSSEEDAGSENDIRTKGRKIMSDTSEDDSQRHQNPPRIKPLRINTEDVDPKPRKIMSDTSEDDTLRLSIARIKVARVHQEDLEPKLRKILSDTSEDDTLKHSVPRSKPSRIQSDESEVDLGYEEQKKGEEYVKKTNDYAGSDLFSNISEDPEHPSQTDIEKEQSEQYHRNSIDSSTSDLPRKKSHKKKQKRQKNPDGNDDGSSKRHNSKKDRRKSSHSHDGEEDLSGQKVRKKKSERDSSSKRDEKMEDIFGPLSDDSDKIHNKWHVSQIYGSDSEEERQVMRKRDKRRKERKARELDEAGRALEAKLLDNSESFPSSEDFAKAKKKKRKKSREEKISKHHQQRLEEEAAALANEADSEREPEPTIGPSSLPRLMDSPPPCVTQNKKPDIPGFGSQVDENIHETAVKSISEAPTKPIVEKREPIEDSVPSANSEDKPTPVISQEETEDAVAALLLEDSFGGGFESYAKPDTPVSEPDLQIDTDTEDTYDPIDFSRPPRTPDIPTSFYRQQDTREGLEERILPLACPDSTSNKQEISHPPTDNPQTHENDYHNNEGQNKITEKSKEENSSVSELPKVKDNTKTSKIEQDHVSKEEDNKTSVVQVESGKRHELPPLVCQGEISHVVQPIKASYSDSKLQVTPEQSLPAVTNAKLVAVETTLTLTTQAKTKALLSPIPPPPLVHTANQICKSVSGDTHTSSNVPLSSSQTEPSRSLQTVQSPINHPTVLSTQQDSTKSKIIHAQLPVQETNQEKSSLATKPVSQIIVTPPTSLALIVQTQPKLPPTNQQPTSVLQLATKIHSPINQQNAPISQQSELKSNAQMPQYVLHHTLQPPQILGSQPGISKLTSQLSSPSSNHGGPGQGSLKLSVPAVPVSSKSPGLSVAAKSPGIPVTSTKSPLQNSPQEQQYKQIVLNHPHNQQLSVNVSHNQQLNANMMLSPSQQMNINHSPVAHHSPVGLNFSPHHIKIPITQHQINNVHQNTMQLSPNIHQQISPLLPQQQKHNMQQHSPALQQQQNIGQHVSPNQLQNKSNSPLLQQVPNCIGSIPVKLCSPNKPGTVHTVRHLSPVSQASSINKLNAHVLQTSGMQQVRAVVLQNPVKQTVTLLQPQVVQKPLSAQMIRPLNAPQPQIVHTLKSDPPVLEKQKISPENMVPKSGVFVPTSNNALKTCEEPLSLTAPKKEDAPVNKEPEITPENTPDSLKQLQIKNKIIRPVVEETKPLNAVIQDLTYKATQAKQASSGLSNQGEEVKSSTSKPLDQVVQEIHDRRKAAEPKDSVNKLDDKVVEPMKPETPPKLELGVDKKEAAKSEEEVETSKESEEKIKVKDEPKIGVIQDPKPLVSEKVNNDDEKPIHLPSEVKKSDTNVSQVEEPKVEKIRIKKEENGLCVDSIPSCTIKEEKPPNDILNDKSEDKDDESKTNVEFSDKFTDGEESKDEAAVPREEVMIPTGRGRGGRRRKASGRAGGVVTRRARLNNSATASNDLASADVYEFRDDSEEEANRPRLILTIKSPPDPVPNQMNNSASTRKSRRLQEKDGSRNTVDDTIEDVIRSTRSSSRRTTRASVNCAGTNVIETRKSPRRKQSSVPPLPPPPVPVITEVVKPVVLEAVSEPSAVPTPLPPPPAPPVQPLPQATTKPPSAEPMTLIDPVTGLLIPMRESEEGQYIPVNSDHVRPVVESKEDTGEPAEKRIRTSLPTESEASLPTRPGIPVKVPPNCAVVPPLPPKPSVVADLSRPLVAHNKPPVTSKTTGIVVPSGIPRPTATLPNPVALTVAAPSLVKPSQTVMMSPTGINKASVTNVVGPMTINRVVAPPPLSPSSKPLSSTTPLTHKTHLLQAVTHRGKVPVAKVPTPMTPKAHILHSMSNVVAREGVVGPGTPPPPHHGTLLTGSVASPPLRAPHHASQQPVVTGASSTRVVCKGLLEPLKVEPGGCIVVPTASPQSRSQVMQAGLPVPAYEASLHGLVAELLPNPQWPRQSPPPAHQPQGEVVQHVNYPPHHIQPAHYVHPQLVYQQYLREAALTGYHLPVKGELEEGVTGSSPPLELRRGSPHDRTTDSPQVATVYVHGPRHLYYDPPPAHRPSQPRGLQVATPPHASQVPPQADSLLMLLQRYPVMWQGLLALKTDQAAVQMHFVFGNPHVARDSLPCNSDGSTPPLRIAQRMRLEQTQVEGVARKMQMDNEHCMLLALPCGRDHMDVLQQSNNLQSGFITYLQQKQAAGIVNIAGPGSQQAAYVVHIFPSCDFANESLARIAPDLLHRVANIAHLLIVIATV